MSMNMGTRLYCYRVGMWIRWKFDNGWVWVWRWIFFTEMDIWCETRARLASLPSLCTVTTLKPT